MKKQDIIEIIDDLKAIKSLTDKEIYLVSKEANQHFVKIFPKLEEELKRMDNNNVEVNCPSIMLIKDAKAKTDFTSTTELINTKIQELVMQDYKIIDFGLQPGNPDIIYIKYTN